MRAATCEERVRRREIGCSMDWTSDRPSGRSLRKLQLALREITEVLAMELARSTDVAPSWSAAEWAVARAVAAIHGVSPLLAGTLRWRGPAAWTEFLAEQRSRTAERFGHMRELLGPIESLARRSGIALVPLKGAALHALGIYAPGERPMADLDLLARPEQSERAAELLAAIGFFETHRTWKHRVFARRNDARPQALGEDAYNGIKIELHCRLAEALPHRIVDISSVVLQRGIEPGLNTYPSRTVLLMHLLLHAAGSMVLRQLRLLQLHDIACLVKQMSDEDWDELFGHAARTGEGSLWWAYPPLTLVSRYYGCVSERALARCARDSHWWLRRVYGRRTLTDASISYLWISAFPGTEWARSAGELLAYVAARFMPSAETMSMRREMARIQPRVSGGEWARLSQHQRVLRWLLSAQARHETLEPVRAALQPASYRDTRLTAA